MEGTSRTKKLVSVLAVIVMLVFGFAGTSYALSYISLVGDKDEAASAVSEPGNMDVYSWYDDDFYWTHSFTPAPPAVSINWATLTIKAYDVDYALGERDHIYAGQSTTGTSIGYLQGPDRDWFKTVFTLPNSLYPDIMDGSFDVSIDIDETHNYEEWAVTVDWSKLEVDYNPVPEPITMLLLGTGLLGLGILRKRAK